MALIVSPSSSRAIAAIDSIDMRSHASTTVCRIISWRRFSGSSSDCNFEELDMVNERNSSPLSVVHARQRPQLSGLLFRRSITQKISAADLGSGEILQEIRPAQRRMKLDVKMKVAIIAAIRRRLMQRHHVRKRHLP